MDFVDVLLVDFIVGVEVLWCVCLNDDVDVGSSKFVCVEFDEFFFEFIWS